MTRPLGAVSRIVPAIRNVVNVARSCLQVGTRGISLLSQGYSTVGNIRYCSSHFYSELKAIPPSHRWKIRLHKVLSAISGILALAGGVVELIYTLDKVKFVALKALTTLRLFAVLGGLSIAASSITFARGFLRLAKGLYMWKNEGLDTDTYHKNQRRMMLKSAVVTLIAAACGIVAMALVLYGGPVGVIIVLGIIAGIYEFGGGLYEDYRKGTIKSDKEKFLPAAWDHIKNVFKETKGNIKNIPSKTASLFARFFHYMTDNSFLESVEEAKLIRQIMKSVNRALSERERRLYINLFNDPEFQEKIKEKTIEEQAEYILRYGYQALVSSNIALGAWA